jgi:hypothetical protein
MSHPGIGDRDKEKGRARHTENITEKTHRINRKRHIRPFYGATERPDCKVFCRLHQL